MFQYVTPSFIFLLHHYYVSVLPNFKSSSSFSFSIHINVALGQQEMLQLELDKDLLDRKPKKKKIHVL